MALPITWTPLADSHLLQMRASGVSWPSVARHLQVGRSAAIERARCLGVRPTAKLPQPKPVPAAPRVDRAPFPAGHPLTWGAIIEHTTLDGSPYPHPVFL